VIEVISRQRRHHHAHRPQTNKKCRPTKFFSTTTVKLQSETTHSHSPFIRSLYVGLDPRFLPSIKACLTSWKTSGFFSIFYSRILFPSLLCAVVYRDRYDPIDRCLFLDKKYIWFICLVPRSIPSTCARENEKTFLYSNLCGSSRRRREENRSCSFIQAFYPILCQSLPSGGKPLWHCLPHTVN